ncbi:MAG: outer membrane protein [Planctomycetia bacterium]
MRTVAAIMIGVSIVGAIADRAVATNGDAASSEERRWYVSGIVGGSFMTLTSGGENTIASVPNTGTATGGAFTGGGAIGIAMPVEGGRWRAEVEGRQRGKLAGQTDFIGDPFFYDVQAEDGWSVTANLWRDVSITNHVDLYAGGGIGGGGYRLSVDDQVFSGGYDRIGEFAWQAGGGIVWNPNRRLAIDLGYRFFAVGTGSTPLTAPIFGGSAGVYTSSLSASELVLTFRIYEPFAALRARR